MKDEVISLLVDNTSVIVLATRGDEILKWARMPLEEGQVTSDVVVDTAAVAARVSELFHDLHLNNTKVSTGLSGVHSLARVISLPPMPERMIGRSVKAKLAIDLPVPLDAFYFSWQIIESTETELKVFSVAYPRNAVDSMLDMLRQAGITATSIDLVPLALARGAGKATAVVVDVRHSEVNIVVLVNKVPEIVRSIILPGDRSLYDNIPIIKEEIYRSISFCMAEKDMANEMAVVLSGEIAGEPDFYTALSRELGYSVVLSSPLLKYPESMTVGRYAVNIGLALREAPPGLEISSVINLDMLPESVSPGPSLWTRIRAWPRQLASSASTMVTRPVNTLYVEDTGLKLLVTKGLKVVKWGQIDLESGLVSDGVVENPAAVAQKVSELFTAHGIHGEKVVVGVSGLHSLHRVLEFPRLSLSELEEAVNRESKRDLPVPLSDLYLSWQVIGTSRDETRVFSIAYPRKLADGLVDMLRQAGMKIQLMDLAPMALARAVGSATAAAVDVRDIEVDITVLTDGVPEVLRTIRFPGGKAIKDRLSLVIEEVRRTLEFYRTNNPSGSALPVFLSGEMVLDPDIYLSWSKELGCPVLPPSPRIYYPDDMPVGSYMTNIGLSLKNVSVRETAIPLVNLNTLPDIYMQRQIPRGRVIAQTAGVIGLALLIFGGFLIWNKTADINLLRSEITDTSVDVVQGTALQRDQEQQIADQEERVSEISTSREALAGAYDMIVNLQQTLNVSLDVVIYSVHDLLKITTMSHSGNIFVVNGEATSEAEIFKYARALNMNNRFSEIVVSRISQSDQQGVTFTLTLECRG